MTESLVTLGSRENTRREKHQCFLQTFERYIWDVTTSRWSMELGKGLDGFMRSRKILSLVNINCRYHSRFESMCKWTRIFCDAEGKGHFWNSRLEWTTVTWIESSRVWSGSALRAQNYQMPQFSIYTGPHKLGCQSVNVVQCHFPNWLLWFMMRQEISHI